MKLDLNGYYAFDDALIDEGSCINLESPSTSREDARKLYPNAQRILKGSTIEANFKSNFPSCYSNVESLIKGALGGAAIGGIAGLGVDAAKYHADTVAQSNRYAGNLNAEMNWRMHNEKRYLPSSTVQNAEADARFMNSSPDMEYNNALLGAGVGALIGGLRGAMKK